RGCAAGEELEALGAVSRRATVGDGARGLLARWGRMELLHARSGAQPLLSLGRGWIAGILRSGRAALFLRGIVERERPDPQGAPFRAERERGKPRRGREGGIFLPRLH